MYYTQQEIDFLLTISWMCRKKVSALFNEKFNKNKSHEAIKRFYTRRGLKRDFKKSPREANSGCFKKGCRSHNEMNIGDEYVNPSSGFVLIKTRKGRIPKHHANWDDEIPKGMMITFRDGDKSNCNKENLMMVSHASLLRFNQSYARISNSENRESLLLMAQIKTEIHKAS